jgi:hypothetical protein
MAGIGQKSKVEAPEISDGTRRLTSEWFSEAVNKHNLALLAMISAFLTGVDIFQSFYLQRVINQFNEVNLLPKAFFGEGIVGYLAYSPIDFLALFATLTVLWIWASYILWYFKNFISPRFR